MRTYQNAMAGEIARFEGIVSKFLGDGVLAYFGFPLAHEDNAERPQGFADHAQEHIVAPARALVLSRAIKEPI